MTAENDAEKRNSSTAAPVRKAAKAVPLSDWLSLMITEVEQKRTQEGVAEDERKRRNDEPPAGGVSAEAQVQSK